MWALSTPAAEIGVSQVLPSNLTLQHPDILCAQSCYRDMPHVLAAAFPKLAPLSSYQRVPAPYRRSQWSKSQETWGGQVSSSGVSEKPKCVFFLCWRESELAPMS